MRKIFIVGNWKCNPLTLKKAKTFFVSLNKGIQKNIKVEIVICPPFVYLQSYEKKSNFKLGAQNCFWEKKGSFTGEISPVMLKNLQCQYVIIGHSERRKFFKEKGEMINKKIQICLREGLVPILCIDKVSQLKSNLKGVLNKSRVIIAYEPISAIGSGKAFDSSKAQKINLKIKNILGDKQIILYGGSVNQNNVLDFIKESGFQGVLVGGKSLEVKDFIQIINKAKTLI